jgi:hypothetical protein
MPWSSWLSPFWNECATVLSIPVAFGTPAWAHMCAPATSMARPKRFHDRARAFWGVAQAGISSDSIGQAALRAMIPEIISTALAHKGRSIHSSFVTARLCNTPSWICTMPPPGKDTPLTGLSVQLISAAGRAACPANSYCPGDGSTRACPANTVSLAFSTKLSDCRTALGPRPAPAPCPGFHF